MSLESGSEPGNVRPFRRPSSHDDKLLTEATFKALMAELQDRLVDKLTRMETSFNRVAKHIEAIRAGEAHSAAFIVTTDHSAIDIALAGISLPKEEHYLYTCTHLTEKLNVRRHDVLTMIKALGLRDDPEYHTLMSTGKASNVPKWSEAAYQRLRQALDSGQYQGHRRYQDSKAQIPKTLILNSLLSI